MSDEIRAISQVNEALQGLEADEITRVLRWALDKYGVDELMSATRSAQSAESSTGPASHEPEAPAPTSAAPPAPRFDRISDLMDTAEPTKGTDYVLLGSYWFQEILGNENFSGQQVNS